MNYTYFITFALARRWIFPHSFASVAASITCSLHDLVFVVFLFDDRMYIDITRSSKVILLVFCFFSPLWLYINAIKFLVKFLMRFFIWFPCGNHCRFHCRNLGLFPWNVSSCYLHICWSWIQRTISCQCSQPLVDYMVLLKFYPRSFDVINLATMTTILQIMWRTLFEGKIWLKLLWGKKLSSEPFKLDSLNSISINRVKHHITFLLSSEPDYFYNLNSSISKKDIF